MSLHHPVYVCTLVEKVFYEGLGYRTEVDVHPAPFAAPLQWWVSVLPLLKSYLTLNLLLRAKELWFRVLTRNIVCFLSNVMEVWHVGYMCCYLSSLLVLFRSIFPTLIPGEQLVSRNVRRFLSSSVSVCPAALLALCLSWHQGSGGLLHYYLTRITLHF